MKPSIDPVEEFYTRHPFPQWDRIEWTPQRLGEINVMAGRQGAHPIPKNARVLIAGCGTRTAIEWGRSLPDAEIYAIDLSPSSIEVTHHLIKEFGQDNVHAEVRDLMTLGEEDGHFDVACATGVLHHLPDPVAGLRTVVDRLTPNGALRMLAYSRRERYWIGEFQDLVHTLSPGADLDTREAVGEALTNDLNLDKSRLGGIVVGARSNLGKNRPAWADAFVHPREVRYDVEALFGWLEEAGAAFLGWRRPSHWDVRWRLPEGVLLEAWQGLSEQARWHVADLVSSPAMSFWCGRADGPPPDYRWIDDADAVLDAVLEPFEMHRSRVEAGRVLPQREVLTPLTPSAVSGRAEVEFTLTNGQVLRVHSFFAEVFAALDGERTLRQAGEVAAAAAGVSFPDVQDSTVGIAKTLIRPHGLLLPASPRRRGLRPVEAQVPSA